jgi:hypothetical protein
MEWINIKDELPKIGQRFLGASLNEYVIDHYIRIGENVYYSLTRNTNTWSYSQAAVLCDLVTHWMPEPPKPEKS